ncbi:uncharacterized protein LOC125229370 [Leguminivora glycinivorella]|uniref:uncharacterized protein LOC125229370 n=1 Tax=Leguminivora glycinivorella TaxID=1035111 RepID=UPI00200C9F67|nr:uncharacterized protein LOC125229370 [Leguminivora glycinivorella]
MLPVVFWGAHHSRTNSNDTGKRSTDADANDLGLLLRLRGGGDAEEAVTEPSPKPAHGGGDSVSEEAAGTPSSPGLALPSPKPAPAGFRPLRDALGRYIRYTVPDTQTGAEDAPVLPGYRQLDRRDLFGEGEADTGDSEGSVEMGPPKAQAEPSTTEMCRKFWGSRPDKRPADDLALSSGSESDAGVGTLLSGTAKRGKKAKGERKIGPLSKTDPLGRTPVVLVERIRLGSGSRLPHETEVTEDTASQLHTTGDYLKAREATKKAKREELRLQEEEEAENFCRSVTARQARLSETSTENHEGNLNDRVDANLKAIKMVADKSSHLKGTFQKALKDSVKALKEVFEELRTHSVSDETRQLEAANKRLKAELADVRCELRKIREDMERLQMPRWDSPPSKAIDREAPQPAAALGRPHVDDLIGAITVKVGRILDDRLGALERDGRLLPNKTGQTPLAVDRGRQAAQTVTPGKAAGGEKSKKKRKKAKSQPTAVAGPSAPSGQQPPPPAPGSSDQQWTSVVSRSARRRAAAQSKTQPQANTKRKAANEKAQAKAKTRSRGLRPPRSAAVVLTLQPEAEANGATYAKVLAVAKEKVKLSDLGISDLRFRRAATGARILQLPGVNSGEKADKLARELAEKLGEEVRVSRPTKCAELRLSNLDDSVTSEEVVAAVARAGECTQDQVKAGEIRRDHTGLGTVWVRCPVTAAKKVSDGGRFLVGWSSAQVKLLEPRILRCYRCLEVGHVRAQCQAQIDRGSLCYRCGKPDHKAAQCSAEPHCAVCEASGKSASHALGSKACTARGQRKDRKTRDGPPAPSQSSQPAATTPAASNALGKQWPLNK